MDERQAKFEALLKTQRDTQSIGDLGIEDPNQALTIINNYTDLDTLSQFYSIIYNRIQFYYNNSKIRTGEFIITDLNESVQNLFNLSKTLLYISMRINQVAPTSFVNFHFDELLR